MEEKLKSWGHLLEKKREDLKLTQFELAQLTQLSDLTIRNIEKGKGSTSLTNWLKVCDVLGYNFDLHIKRMSHEDRKSIQQ
jgi:DNA-binding XRE family transcriptional regulator